MSDFEDRLSEALSGGATDAPPGHRLAEAARQRRRVRRQRLAAASGAAAVLALVLPIALLSGSGDVTPSKDDEAAPPADLPDTLVTCVSWASWPASAMIEGIPNELDDADVRDAFARLREDAGIDAPRAIQDQAADAPYVVLAVSEREAALAVGEWTLEGPRDDGQVVELKRTAEGFRAVGWSECRDLRVALPEGRSQVVVTAPRGGVDGRTATPEVMVHEVDCASSRDPRPYLGEPHVVETEARVFVTLSSRQFQGAATCPGNPHVPLTLELDQPIGARQLFDAGTWPPTPIPVAVETSRTIVESGVVVGALPAGWREWRCASPDGELYPVWGPTEEDACGFRTGLAFYGSDTFDPLSRPSGVILRDRSKGVTTWSGYVLAGDTAVWVATPDRSLTRRLLDSAQVADE